MSAACRCVCQLTVRPEPRQARPPRHGCLQTGLPGWFLPLRQHFRTLPMLQVGVKGRCDWWETVSIGGAHSGPGTQITFFHLYLSPTAAQTL